MAQLLIRRLDDEVKERLRSRAKAHGVSMEEEARTILLEKLAPAQAEDTRGLGTRIAELFRDIPDNDEPLNFESHDAFRPLKFD
jgi:plasmid stability protein